MYSTTASVESHWEKESGGSQGRVKDKAGFVLFSSPTTARLSWVPSLLLSPQHLLTEAF